MACRMKASQPGVSIVSVPLAPWRDQGRFERPIWPTMEAPALSLPTADTATAVPVRSGDPPGLSLFVLSGAENLRWNLLLLHMNAVLHWWRLSLFALTRMLLA